MFVFVYGTLKTGFNANRFLEDSTFMGVGESLDVYDMLSGEFPMVVDSYLREPLPIVGEVYHVNTGTLELVDEYEGYPYLFTRKIVPVMIDGTQYDCLMYIYNMEGDEHDTHAMAEADSNVYNW